MTNVVYIEHDGALFRGSSRSLPKEVWSFKEQRWKPYAFDAQWKPVEWGTEITEREFARLAREQ